MYLNLVQLLEQVLGVIGSQVQAYDADLDNIWLSICCCFSCINFRQILDGATVTTAELNILDGVTSTASELNILDELQTTAEQSGWWNICNFNNFSSSRSFICNDNGTMKQVALSDVVTFLEDESASSFNIDGGSY